MYEDMLGDAVHPPVAKLNAMGVEVSNEDIPNPVKVMGNSRRPDAETEFASIEIDESLAVELAGVTMAPDIVTSMVWAVDPRVGNSEDPKLTQTPAGRVEVDSPKEVVGTEELICSSNFSLAGKLIEDPPLAKFA